MTVKARHRFHGVPVWTHELKPQKARYVFEDPRAPGTMTYEVVTIDGVHRRKVDPQGAEIYSGYVEGRNITDLDLVIPRKLTGFTTKLVWEVTPPWKNGFPRPGKER